MTKVSFAVKCAMLSCIGISFLSGCGGGGSSTSKNLSKNACSELGLSTVIPLILDGASCGNLSASPVVRVLLRSGRGGTDALCTGTMLSPTKVLTAGHCFVLNPSEISIGYGDSSNLRTVPVASVAVHPNFELKSSEVLNDVAVLTLTSAVALPTLPIILSKATEVGNIASIFGYGTDASSVLDGAILRSGQVEISTVEDGKVSSLYDGRGSNTCQGDSGGPLVRRAKRHYGVIGITSTGTRSDCQIGDMTTYTNLQTQSILDFILNIAPEARLL